MTFPPLYRHIQDLFNAADLGTDAEMKNLSVILASSAMVTLAAAPALHANPGNGEQGEVRKERRAGNIRPVRDIEREVLPRMGNMQYLGPEYDPAAMSYRLKFIEKGKVRFVDVDARTGRIIGQSR